MLRVRRPVAVVLAGGLALVLVLFAPAGVAAQEPPPSGVPTPHIIPRPNSGHAPTEAGDRGGALQLAVLGLVVVGIGGAVLHLVRQSRRSRSST